MYHLARRTRALAPIAVALSLATLAACGDGDGDAAPPVPDTISRSTWIQDVNAMCVAHNDALGAIIGPLFATGPPTPDAAQAALDQIVERTRAVTDRIEALPEPSALTIHVDALVAALDAGSDQAAAMGGAAYFADEDGDPYRPAGDIAGELGLEACDTEG